MCCLFGVMTYGKKIFKQMDELVNSLAYHATERGIDSTGIAYNKEGKLIVYKKPLPAYKMDFVGLDCVKTVMGHTRQTTQGLAKFNYNNHPFRGTCFNTQFALAHNGIIWNDFDIRRDYGLPSTKIITDSYIAVQLIEHYQSLSMSTLRKMAETVRGSFVFSVLDATNNLWLVKGDNPLCIIKFPKLNLYVYASTREILLKALVEVDVLCDAILSNQFEIVNVASGEILQITNKGKINRGKFDIVQNYFPKWHWTNSYSSYDYSDNDLSDYTSISTIKSSADEDYTTYVDYLKLYAERVGIDGKLVDQLLAADFTLEEVEDYLYAIEVR